MKKHCHTNNDVPKVRHYAIISFGSYTVPGDERSRTDPGHGYPEHSEATADYVAYLDRDEWEKDIAHVSNKSGYYREDFVALIVEPATITTEIKVNIGGPNA